MRTELIVVHKNTRTFPVPGGLKNTVIGSQFQKENIERTPCIRETSRVSVSIKASACEGSKLLELNSCRRASATNDS